MTIKTSWHARPALLLLLFGLILNASAVPRASAKSAFGKHAIENSRVMFGATRRRGVRFVNGRYEAEIPSAFEKVRASITSIAIQKSGAKPLAAAIVESDLGGTGMFVDLAAFVERNGKPYNIDTVGLGDRTIIRSLEVRDGRIYLNAVFHAASDGECCPSLLKLVVFAIRRGKLVSVSETLLRHRQHHR